jgi:LysM repeat protein
MATVGTNVSVTTSATLLWRTSTGVSPDVAISGQTVRASTMNDPVPIIIRNEDGTNACTLCGVAGVAGTGTTLKAGESLTFNVVGNDSMYAIVATTGVTVSVTFMKQ